jgi:precorrin-6B methylase 2
MCSALIKNGFQIIEVGSQEGKFAEFLAVVKLKVSVMAIDVNTDLIMERGVLTRMTNVEIVKGDSSQVLASLNQKYDFIYIDGDHSYEGVKKDAFAADKLLDPNGLLVFNDYTLWSYLEQIPYGIPHVIHELIDSGNYKMVGFAFHPWGYHDVALIKING